MRERDPALRRTLISLMGMSRFLEQARKKTLDRDVDLAGMRAPPGVDDLLCRILRRVPSDVENRHARPLARQPARGGMTEPRPASGNDGNPAGEAIRPGVIGCAHGPSPTRGASRHLPCRPMAG